MTEYLLAHEVPIRLAAFLAVFTTMASWELIAPRRTSDVPRRLRWPANLGIVIIDRLTLRVLLPVAAVGIAQVVEERNWGLLQNVPLPSWLAITIAIILLDLAIYLQHVLFHAVPLFWRLHRMHHADVHIDVTTGARFHPIEILLSMVIKLGVVVALGAPAVAVLLFEIILNATSTFNHSNVRLTARIDRVLRWLLVTPDMHRVHHSVIARETNSNFGFSLPWWDRIFGTYRAQPQEGHDGMTIGLSYFRDPIEQRLGRMLVQPFRKEETRVKSDE